MKLNFKWMIFLLAAIVFYSNTSAQKVELIYTAAGLNKALEFKAAEHMKGANATNALSLMNISDERKNAYLNGLKGFSAAIIFGESALKAISSINYNIPVVILNAEGSHTAKAGVVRIFDEEFKGSVSGAKPVTDLNSIGLSKSDFTSGKEVSLKCQGVSSVALADKIILMLSK